VKLTWTGVWSPGEQQHFFIGRDVTELNESERLLREAKAAHEQAVSANLAKSRFLATASHDLRQPLHAMNLFISALRRRVEGDEAIRLVDGMAAATASMQAMFNAVLDVTKLEAGAVTPAFTDFELEQVLDRLRASFAGPAAAKELELDIPPTVALVHSDPVLLESVLRNLLSNAVRYTSQGEVTLTCETRGSFVRIEVFDTGPGIPVSEREHIFEEFHRLHNASTTERGLGLGLAIVRRLAELLGVGVELASEVGIGSVFALTVPGAITAIAPAQHPGDH
jgi:two-component system CheB/CheR fusion protein